MKIFGRYLAVDSQSQDGIELAQLEQSLKNLLGVTVNKPVTLDTLNLIQSGQIQAIKDLRERTDMPLKEAKDYIEAIMRLGVIEYTKVQNARDEQIVLNGVTYKKV
jgi:predicted transcriptional regulator